MSPTSAIHCSYCLFTHPFRSSFPCLLGFPGPSLCSATSSHTFFLLQLAIFLPPTHSHWPYFKFYWVDKIRKELPHSLTTELLLDAVAIPSLLFQQMISWSSVETDAPKANLTASALKLIISYISKDFTTHGIVPFPASSISSQK